MKNKKTPAEIIQFWPKKFSPFHLKAFGPIQKERDALLKLANVNGWITQDENGFYQKTEFCPDALQFFPVCFTLAYAANEIGQGSIIAITFLILSGSIKPDDKGEMFCKI